MLRGFKWMALTVVVNHHKPHKLNGDLVRFSAAGTFCPVIACYQGTEQPPWIAMCNRHENRSWKLPYTQIAHFISLKITGRYVHGSNPTAVQEVET